MEIVTWLLIAGVISGGVAGALLRTWALHSRTYSLETRVAMLEGITTREVKARAANERWRKPSRDEDLAALAALAPKIPERKLNYWENPALKKGAHVS